MKHWLARPTLARRVFLVVLLAFFLVLVSLQAYMYLSFKRSLATDQGLSRLGRALTEALTPVQDVQQAITLVRSTETIYQRLRISGNPAGTLVLQLYDQEGTLLYSSAALNALRLSGPADRVHTTLIDNTSYWVYPNEAGRWRLVLAEPERTASKVLRNNTRVMLPYLLIALPIVLIPVWLAVLLGLRPLRQLAQRLNARNSMDLASLNFQARHAELRPLVESLENLLLQLRTRVARDRAFVQDAAHELRTPMAVIAAQAHALVGAASAEQKVDAQRQLEHAIARASNLTQQLLELARLDEVQRVDAARIDVAQQVRQLLAQVAPRALTRSIDLTLVAPDILLATVEVWAFQAIVQNLVDNALAHTSPGSSVVVTLACSPNQLQLTVEDDGPGVPETAVELVFERFHRGLDPQTSGTGLGLAIVRQAAARMGGQVRLAKGLQGQGAGFHVVIPQP